MSRSGTGCVMEFKMFYKTQRELADVINQVIDLYWSDDITDTEMIDTIKKLYANNSTKMIKEGDFTTVLKQQCGKRRLEVVQRIIEIKQV